MVKGKGSDWDEWPCSHACTAFFHIARSEVERFVPAPLVVDEVARGVAKIEVGFVRFRDGIHGLPPTDELAWGIAVKRVKGFGFAFYAMNIAADNEGFLDWNAAVGFRVHRPPVRFRVDLDARSFAVRDAADNPICTLRHQPSGSVPLPFLPVTTEVWTGPEGALRRRVFKWRGMAKLHFASSVATTLHDHPFFLDARVSRANPLPETILSSARIARSASQLFSSPTPG